MIVVGPAQTSDAAAVIRFASREAPEPHAPEWWVAHLEHGDCTVARDVRDDHIVAVAVTERQEPCEGHLCALAVEREHQGQGIGSNLLRTVQDHLARSGVYRLTLDVRADDTYATAFYARHGFAPEGLLEHAYGDGSAAVRLARPL